MNEVATMTGTSLEQVLIGGDLSKLTPADRVMYYKAVCESVGLNPLTKPFAYITLNGKLTLYALRDATDQLRQLHKISIEILSREIVEDCYVVTARASNAVRQDESIGAVTIAALKGDARANAMMKAETKAKRRVTLSICGLGMLDETEVETIAGARITPSVDIEKQLDNEQMAHVEEVVANMREFLANGEVDDAVYTMENAALDAEEQIYLWTHFDSKQRSAMKKEQARLRALHQSQPTPPQIAAPQVSDSASPVLQPDRPTMPAGAASLFITPAAHKRLEARITELGANRDEVKAYVKKQFGKDHFPELTKDEYEQLDEILNKKERKLHAVAAEPQEDEPV